jgi:hypothetical protein
MARRNQLPPELQGLLKVRTSTAVDWAIAGSVGVSLVTGMSLLIALLLVVRPAAYF